MDSRAILERIVEENGSCIWAAKFHPSNVNYICERCPMSKLKKHSDGRYLSCYEALGCDDIPLNEHDEKYKGVAERMLSDLSIEDMLES